GAAGDRDAGREPAMRHARAHAVAAAVEVEEDAIAVGTGAAQPLGGHARELAALDCEALGQGRRGPHAVEDLTLLGEGHPGLEGGGELLAQHRPELISNRRVHRPDASSPWWKSARRLAPGSSPLARRRNAVVPGVLQVSPTKPAAARPSETACRLSPRAARGRGRRGASGSGPRGPSRPWRGSRTSRRSRRSPRRGR